MIYIYNDKKGDIMNNDINYINNYIQNIQLLQELADTRIVNFVPTTSLYAKSNIRFKGRLEFYDDVAKLWFPINSVPVYVTIKDRNDKVLGEVVGVTSTGFFDIGNFETTNFYIPYYYANTDIVVEAKFNGGVSSGGGTFKPADYYTIYHISGICQNVSSRTGECTTGEEFPLTALLTGVAITAIIYESYKRKKK